MKHTYSVTGMTCSSCEEKVKNALLSLPEITNANVNKDKGTAEVEMSNHIATSAMQQVLGEKYSISMQHETSNVFNQEKEKSWFQTYKPILLVFAYLFVTTLLIHFFSENDFNFKTWMRHFMAGFFLVFSFFKMLDLEGFKNSYLSYDIIAKVFPSWGYIYAFIELTLGLGFLIGENLLVLNIIAFVVMTISIIGVLQSVLNKRKIQCACLGAVFDLPMSTVTIIEDALMIVMSGYMIYSLI
ncbi:heavy-metal-associated domain-containing protein [Flavobacterium okayamense]|uniref:HMA domain-containing protein n=1 Tax=Flavobacterium okayamense TaxID=2830782 RepID=A0ABM7S5E1_9FLAO|nr:heavy metal-associated domain-containing protein [Flavobacterium okayamense]BCY28618.1 hypothetical protein KK2020170_14860 [Flavobacterium okayamense]